ncbi:MAG: hypothetical protein HC930_09430 [Hydrococcus sp. SU_1_0]|nr:hypothetical protein [Hydrococcus sp. SU_1_0]
MNNPEAAAAAPPRAAAPPAIAAPPALVIPSMMPVPPALGRLGSRSALISGVVIFPARSVMPVVTSLTRSPRCSPMFRSVFCSDQEDLD